MANKFLTDIELDAGLVDNNNVNGDAGDVLSSTGTGVEWIPQSSVVATSDFMFYYVKNSTGVTISKGKGVMAVGTDGNSGHILVDEMVADGTVEARYFLGLMEEDIANGEIKRAISFGELDQFNTNGQNGETWAGGDVLWCDPDSAGDFTITEPDGPNVKIPAAFVLKASTQGKVQIRVQANEGLHQLHDTNISNQANGDLLQWNSTAGVWENKTLASIADSRYVNVTGDTMTGNLSLGSNTLTAGTITATGGNSTEWNTAYDNSIVSASVTGTTTKTLTLTQQDTGTVTASWSDETGSNNYVTSATFNTLDGILTLNRSGLTAVTVDLDGRYVTSSGVTSVATSGPITGGTITSTGTIGITQATSTSSGYLSSTDWNTFNNKTSNAGTVTSVAVSGGTGISVSGSPITSSGTITVTNSDRGSAQNIFKNFAVSGQTTVTADSNNDTLTLVAGTNVSITTNATTDAITINSTDQYTGTVTSVAATAGSGISISGSPITTSGTFTITNSDRGSSQAIFKNFAVSGQSTVVADSNNDTLTLVAGSNVTITTNATTDAITINSSDQYTGTVTSVAASAGTGISISGSPITTSGTLTVTNTAPNVTTNLSTTHTSTNVTVNSSDGTNGTINAATTALAGVMTAADKSKLNGIASGATANTGTVTSVATTAPITGGTITGSGTIGITQATSSTSGYLSSTDWNTFNGKQAAGSYVTTNTAQTISGTKTFSSAGINFNYGNMLKFIAYNDSDTYMGQTSSDYFYIGHDGVLGSNAIITIPAIAPYKGNVGIGTTSPVEKLDVSGSIKATGQIWSGYDAGQNGSVSCSNWFRSSGGTGWYNASYGGGIYMTDGTNVTVYNNKAFRVNNTGTLSIRSAGDIVAYYSDERLKTNLGNITNAVDKIKQLNGFYYTNNELAQEFGYTEEQVQVGVSAQEVENVMPEVVKPAPFDLGVNEDGSTYSISGDDYKTVKYEKLVPLLIEAIKEQQQQIDELKAIINGASN